MSDAKFSIGQIIHHQLFEYNGVIIDVDYKYLGTKLWYEQVARSRPPKNQPWYHVLVGGSNHQTYVAERHIEASEYNAPIHHPLLDYYFDGMEGGSYQLRTRKN